MAFKSIIPPSATRPKTETRWIPQSLALQHMITQNFQLTTILLFGALIQGTFLLLIPRLWILLPTLIILLARFFNTLAITFKLKPNPHMTDALFYRTSALIPNTDGELPTQSQPATEKIAVLMLTMRINHPLGYFAPGMQQIGALNTTMSRALDAEAPSNGFLGQSQYTSKTASGSIDIMLLSFWRDIADVLAFSQGPSHKETWTYWEANAADLKHVGISHEVFQADKAMYESVYINFQPTRLGATSYFRKGDEMLGGTVPDSWVSPLVDASKGKLRNSKGRLGWRTEEEREGFLEKQGY